MDIEQNHWGGKISKDVSKGTEIKAGKGSDAHSTKYAIFPVNHITI